MSGCHAPSFDTHTADGAPIALWCGTVGGGSDIAREMARRGARANAVRGGCGRGEKGVWCATFALVERRGGLGGEGWVGCLGVGKTRDRVFVEVVVICSDR